MKIHIKRNELRYKGEKYSVEVLIGAENECACISQIGYTVKDNNYHDSFDYKNIKVGAFLVSKYMETEVDYDWEENPIYNYYEAENYIPINYCLLCGDKIEIIVDEVVDMTDKVVPLIDEMKGLEKKRDSRKRRERTWELDDEIRKIMFG